MVIENGDAQRLAEKVADVEDERIRKLFTEKRRSDWMKILVGSLLTLLGIFAVTLMDIGGYRENVKVLNSMVHTHIEEYTPAKAAQLSDLKSRVDVNTERIANIKEQLDKIERNQSDMLKLLQRHMEK